MSEELDLELLNAWWNAFNEAEAAKAVIRREQELRKQVFEYYFKDPREGTNYLDLPNGWRLKAIYKLDRKIDEAALPAVKEQLKELGVNVDALVEYKPTLKTKLYRELTAEQSRIFDQALTIKPSSPIIELVEPEETK